MGNLKVSVIGTGHLGTIHARLWKELIGSELLGVFDADVFKSSQLANDLKCNKFHSLEECLDWSDAVTIAVPTSLHYEIALLCIEQGIHCLIEKPITENYKQSKEIIEKAKENNVKIQVGHVERFNPALSALKNYKLNPVFIEAHRLSQFKPRATDVSVVLDLMIHDIDIMLWLVKSQVAKIDANGVSVLTDTTDIANARITFENGAVANLTASRISARPMRKMRLFQQNSYISIDFGKQDVEIFRLMDENAPMEDNLVPATMLGTIDAGVNNKKIIFEKPQVIEINAIAEEQKAFIETIINKSPVAVTAFEASEALRIAELIAEQIGEK